MCDYQESGTTVHTHRQTDGRTDRRRTKWSLCAAMLRWRHNKFTSALRCLEVEWRNTLGCSMCDVRKMTSSFEKHEEMQVRNVIGPGVRRWTSPVSNVLYMDIVIKNNKKEAFARYLLQIHETINVSIIYFSLTGRTTGRWLQYNSQSRAIKPVLYYLSAISGQYGSYRWLWNRHFRRQSPLITAECFCDDDDGCTIPPCYSKLLIGFYCKCGGETKWHTIYMWYTRVVIKRDITWIWHFCFVLNRLEFNSNITLNYMYACLNHSCD